MLEGKKTYLVAIATILSAVASALAGTIDWAAALALIVPAVLGMTIRSGVTAESAKRAAGVLLVGAMLALTGCVTPEANQGQQGQGGSIDRMPIVNVTVTFSGDVKVDGTAAPTAAPSAASTASATQDGKVTPTVDVQPIAGDSAISAALGALVPAPVAPATPAVPE